MANCKKRFPIALYEWRCLQSAEQGEFDENETNDNSRYRDRGVFFACR
jgi:hypothetical protein